MDTDCSKIIFHSELGSVTNNLEIPLAEIYFCKICETPTRSYCKACSNAYYCCKDHQKKHWKIHKKECFPLRIVHDHKNVQRKLVATKDVRQGQVILEEYPIFVTPNTRTENGVTCLGCCKKLENSWVSCIRCGWPLCSLNCDMEDLHAENECQVFQKNKISPPLPDLGHTYQKFCEIGVLRMLMLKSKNPNLWSKLLEQEPFKEARKETKDNVFNMRSIIRFIQDDCKMEDINEEIIDTAFGILRGNSFDTSEHSGFIQCCVNDVRCASVIFPTAIIPGPNCIPNASYSIHGRQNGNFKIVCVSTVDISKGELISMPYEDEMSGTFFRRNVKEMVFFQSCICPLCIDPSESETFISALKCESCPAGIMLATNPLSAESEWKCQVPSCSFIITHLRMLEILQLAKTKLKECVSLSSSQASIEDINEVAKFSLNPNHFLILQTEIEICRRILQVIGLFELKNFTFNLSTMLENLVKISRHVLSVADVLRPGYSRIRGRLLYCLQFGLLVLLLNDEGIQSQQKGLQTVEMKQEKAKKMEELRQVQREAEMILALIETDESSEEYQMLKTLKGELKMAFKTIH